MSPRESAGALPAAPAVGYFPPPGGNFEKCPAPGCKQGPFCWRQQNQILDHLRTGAGAGVDNSENSRRPHAQLGRLDKRVDAIRRRADDLVLAVVNATLDALTYGRP